MIAECRAKAAGKPKTKPGIHSLDENQDWEEDCSCIGADAFSEACMSGNEDSESDSDPWVPHAEETPALTSQSTSAPTSPAKLDSWSGVGSLDPWTKTSAETMPKELESIGEAIRRRQEEMKKKVAEMLGKAVVPPVPEAPPGMQRWKR